MGEPKALPGSVRPWLERALNTAIILAAIGCVGAWTYYYYYYWFRPATAGRLVPQYAVGDSLAGVPELAALGAEPTMLLFLNSSCNICTESAPFYRRLINQRRERGAKVRIVAASRESYDNFRRYLLAQGVTPDAAIYIRDDSPFTLTRTPTIVLLDGARRVEGVWLGRLTSSGESEVLSSIGAARP